MTLDIHRLRSGIGRSTTQDGLVTAMPLQALTATPVPLLRRRWAGSRREFLAPIRVGQAISRNARSLSPWARTPDGQLAMAASATLA